MKQLKIAKQITNRESESVDKYLQEIAKLSMISAEEEVDLAKRIKEGDASALDKLTKANLRFVVSVAKQYQNRGLPLNDLINEGNVGLIKAGLRFDETRGFKFISYAVWWIRQSIIQAIADQTRVVRLPLNKISSISRTSKVFAELEQNLERDPTPFELAESLKTTVENITDEMIISQRSISTDHPLRQDDTLVLLDTIPDAEAPAPDSSLMEAALKLEIKRALSALPAREMEIVVLFYGLNEELPLSMDKIGERLSITRERVRQLKEKATRQLRGSIHIGNLKMYLE